MASSVPNFFEEAKRAASNSELIQKRERNRKANNTVYAEMPTHGSRQRLHGGGMSLPEKATIARAVHTSVKKEDRLSNSSRGVPPFAVPTFNPDVETHT